MPTPPSRNDRAAFRILETSDLAAETILYIAMPRNT